MKKGLTKGFALIWVFTFVFTYLLTMHVSAAANNLITALDPLMVTNTTPANGNTNAPINENITITFNRAIQPGSSFNNIKMSYMNAEVSMDPIINGNTITIVPRGVLNNGGSYSIIVPVGAVRDAAGNESGTSYNLIFITGTEKVPPEIITSYPADKTKYVAINSSITVIFSEGIVYTGGSWAVTLKDSKNNIPVSVSTSYNTMSIYLTQNLNMAYNTTYTLSIQAGAIKDWAGNAMKSNYTIKFTTETWATKPKVIAASPSDAASGVQVSTSMVISYNEKIQRGTRFDSIVLKDEKNNVVETLITIDNNLLKIRPVTNMNYDTLYNLTIPYGTIKGLSGSVSKDTYNFTFRTAKETFPPKINYTYPSAGAANTAVDSTINIFFDEYIEKSENYSNIMLRDSKYNNIPITLEIKDNLLSIKLSNELNMSYNTQYTVVIPYNSIKDKVGNPFMGTSTLSFTTGSERFCPVVKYAEPAADSKDVGVDAVLDIVFSDIMQKGDNFEGIVLKSSKNECIELKAYIESDVLKIKPVKELDYNTQYKLIIPVGALRDIWGNIMKNEYSMTLTTGIEKIAPRVINTSPVSESVNVDVKSMINIKFTEEIKKTRDFEKVFFVDSVGKKVTFTAEVNKDVLIIKPNAPLGYVSIYSLWIPKEGITDMAGNLLKEDCSLTFFTSEEPGIEDEVDKNALGISKVVYNKDYSMAAVYFSENIKAGSGIKNVTIKDSTGKNIGIPYRLQNNMLIVRAKTVVAPNKKYVLVIPKTAVIGVNGKNLRSEYTAEFIRK